MNFNHAHVSELRPEKSKTKDGTRCCFMSVKSILDKLTRSEVIAVATNLHNTNRALHVLSDVREALPNYQQARIVNF